MSDVFRNGGSPGHQANLFWFIQERLKRANIFSKPKGNILQHFKVVTYHLRNIDVNIKVVGSVPCVYSFTLFLNANFSYIKHARFYFN